MFLPHLPAAVSPRLTRFPSASYTCTFRSSGYSVQLTTTCGLRHVGFVCDGSKLWHILTYEGRETAFEQYGRRPVECLRSPSNPLNN
jgi:hypothetical protein